VVSENFRIEIVEDRPQLHVVRLVGELDIAAADAVEDELVRMASPTVVADLGELSFIDAAGIGAIVGAKREVEAAHHRLELCGARSRVRLVFEVCGLADLLTG